VVRRRRVEMGRWRWRRCRDRASVTQRRDQRRCGRYLVPV
jgi:hypothetical protein